MRSHKVNLNKLTVGRVVKDYNLKLIYNEDGSEKRHFSNWIVKNDNCISDFSKNFYIRTTKSVDRNYNNLDKTLAKEYTAIKTLLTKTSNLRIIGIELINKKRQYDTMAESIIIFK